MEKQLPNQQETNVFHNMNDKNASLLTPGVIVIFLLIILGGIVSGYFLSQRTSISSSASNTVATSGSSKIQKGTQYGSNDTATFKDTTEGVVQNGGIDGEGQFHLVRPGGDSQNVYLTSSLVDLSQFIGHKVKVWGQTQAAKKAGWLMDVGRVEVLE